MKAKRKSEVAAFEQAREQHEQNLEAHRAAVQLVEEENAKFVEIHDRAVEERERMIEVDEESRKATILRRAREAIRPTPPLVLEEVPEPVKLDSPPEPEFTFPEAKEYDVLVAEKQEQVTTAAGPALALPGNYIVSDPETHLATIFTAEDFERKFEKA
jgi:RNase P/RNase MRP subunit p29